MLTLCANKSGVVRVLCTFPPRGAVRFPIFGPGHELHTVFGFFFRPFLISVVVPSVHLLLPFAVIRHACIHFYTGAFKCACSTNQ